MFTKQVWSREGGNENAWLPGHVHWVSDVSSYQLAFQVKRMQGWSGDVSIDDVLFNDGYCFETDQACEFENNFCDWNNDPDADYQWMRINSGLFRHNRYHNLNQIVFA